MDFRSNATIEAARGQMQQFIRMFLTPDVLETARSTGTVHDWTFHRALADHGWLTAALPTSEGGRGYGPTEMFAVLEEMAAAGAPIDGLTVTMNVLETVKRHGEPALYEDMQLKVYRGDAIVCLGLSEPEAGSDVAAVRTRAVRNGDGWTINGQKIFTTLAHEASWVFLLARTDPDKPKHKGLTVFIVPTNSPGIEIQPVRTLGGERTNVTFYNDVAVSDTYRVGDVDGGWPVVMSMLALERGGAFGGISLFTGTLLRLLRAFRAWALVLDGGVEDVDQQSAVGRMIEIHLGRILARQRAAQLLSLRSIATSVRDASEATVAAAMAKLYTTELLQESADVLLNTVGVQGLLNGDEADSPAHGAFEEAYRHTAVVTIYGGTSEMMRSVISSQGLRLPTSQGGS